jgi:hypothetical protein
MTLKQEHNSEGDNIAGDKHEEHNYYSNSGFDISINSKINELEIINKLDFTDNSVLKAIKETLLELIKNEQEKSHNLVPIGHIRNKFKYFQEDFFAKTMKDLNTEQSVKIDNVQVCYIPKDLNYSIEI